mgnify:CR=1 FL=1
MKPSRKPVPEPAARAPQQTPVMSARERELWDAVEGRKATCHGCDGRAERVVKIGGVHRISCWDDHP